MHRRRTQEALRDRDDLRTLRAILPFVWRYRGRAGLALACLVAAKLATVSVPVALKGIVDALDAAPGEAVLPLGLLLGYGALRAAQGMFNELRDAVFARVRHGAVREVSRRVLRHLYDLSLRYHLERKTGAISRDIERGTRSLSSLLNYAVFSIIPTAVELALVGAILVVRYDLRYLAVTVVAVVLYVGYTVLVTEWRMRFRHRMNAMDSKANTLAVDGLINYETVKCFNNEAYELARYDRTLAEWERAAVRTQTSLSALNFGQGAIIAAAVTAIMVMAAQGVVAGTLSLGDLVMVNAFMLQLFIPLGFLGMVYSQVKHALSDMEMMFRLLEEEPEIRDRPGAPALVLRRGAVRFEHVHFGYQPERPILHDVDFEIPPGARVAVVGPSGAGKSTLARLLFRFYDVQRGRILIDGQDIRAVTQASLRAAIGIVPQDTVLFNETIYYNIAYGRPDATRAEVEEAARLAHLADFIASLPAGWDTVVGERGLKLSGGEKQRVAIARAILKRPRILIFDEATSSLDSASERIILEALAEVAAARTTLVIAHRLSTVADADQILVLEGGRIVERGDHAALLARGALYAKMWALQQQEEAPVAVRAGGSSE
ncbi:ABCB family ABC transporter ATP-binding protein/permease [Inmirania thermothiophila]|uniref:ATP-binding cassette subfamily B protein n=1 Tax=Inmirania thermothiophila TaxID=1750597 RepID=A0A3N1XUF1_9GAMM|nr:ABC transporter ATP-binding protein/permease [Inmirania thermothiophila]ROR29811.1 ATP-binding cassette subfamily B protein [Inmirania thermothiophila]